MGHRPAPLSTDREHAQVAGPGALCLSHYRVRGGVNWREVARSTLVPSIPHSGAEWSMLVALLGTTISPYLFFWQASEEVEEEKAAGQSTLAMRKGASGQELEMRNIDVALARFSRIW